MPVPPKGRALIALPLVSLVVATACGAVKPVDGQLAEEASRPPWLAEPLDSAPAPLPQSPVEAIPGVVHDPDAPVFDPQTVTPLLSDPRLAPVVAQLDREADKGAADALQAIIDGGQLSDEERPRFDYLLGRLRLRAGDPAAAVRAFDRVAAGDGVLAGYARFHAGDLLVRMDEPGEGLARLATVPAELPIQTEVQLAIAAGKVAQRDVDGATPIYRAYLAQRPRPQDWVVVALRYVDSLLQQPSVEHAEEAIVIAEEVMFNGPNGRGVGEARDKRDKALETLPSKRRIPFKSPELSKLVERARALAESGQSREAQHAADDILEKLVTADGAEDTTPSEASCEAYLARAKGLAGVRRYAEASDAADVALLRCEGLERQVAAYFLAGRYAWRGGKAAQARKHYAELERRFPKHSYADDARLHGAEAAREMGDVATFTRLLQPIADDYPDGDMVDEALFTLARDRIAEGDWAGAVTPLERAVAMRERGRPYYAEGRPQYFLARAKLELGEIAEGRAGLEAVVRRFPLSYYMVLAHSRLHALDATRAQALLHDALAAEPDGAFVIPDHAELHRPGFLRAAELVRVGDGERALGELEALGIRDPDAHPSLIWAGAMILSHVDAPDASHGVLRSATKIWQEHFPSGAWRPLWEVAYPRPFLPIVEKEAAASGIPMHLAYAIMREESAFKPRAVSHAGAYGLMQLILPTAERVARGLGLSATRSSLKTPPVNIALGCRFLSLLAKRFDYDPLLAIPGYNAGPGGPLTWLKERPEEDFDVWVERIPYRETRHYTKRVIQSMAAYAMLYGKGLGDRWMRPPLVVAPPDTDFK